MGDLYYSVVTLPPRPRGTVAAVAADAAAAAAAVATSCAGVTATAR